MNIEEIIKSGETSRVQFKRGFDNQDKIATEMIAFANSKGGLLLFGINDKTGEIVGLNYEEIQKTCNKVSTIANELIKPQIQILTEVVVIETISGKKNILLVTIEEGIAKPYKDLSGICWIKRGSDKRRVTDNFELLRLFQQSGILHFDEMKVPDTGKKDIEERIVRDYLRKIGKKSEDEDIQLNDTLYKNLNILNGENITLGGLLFFGKNNNPQRYRPAFCIKAISFFGNSIGGTEYRDSRDITGTIPEMFSEGMRFFSGNLHHVQAGQNFNSTGILEISPIALEEVLQNALIHRDYTKNAPVRLMIFDNRIELVSPGCLPNNLTVEQIKLGNAAVRNNLIISFCSKLMTYRGFGSGIIRAIENQPNINFINDEEGEQFIIIIPRRENQVSTGNNIASPVENIASSTGNIATSKEFIATSVDNIATSKGNIATSNVNLTATSENNDSVCTSKKRFSNKELDRVIVSECRDYLSLDELAEKAGKNKTYLKNFFISRLVKEGKLQRLYPDTPNHPKQKYISGGCISNLIACP